MADGEMPAGKTANASKRLALYIQAQNPLYTLSRNPVWRVAHAMCRVVVHFRVSSVHS
jgi:hypothetical protein